MVFLSNCKQIQKRCDAILGTQIGYMKIEELSIMIAEAYNDMIFSLVRSFKSFLGFTKW